MCAAVSPTGQCKEQPLKNDRAAKSNVLAGPDPASDRCDRTVSCEAVMAASNRVEHHRPRAELSRRPDSRNRTYGSHGANMHDLLSAMPPNDVSAARSAAVGSRRGLWREGRACAGAWTGSERWPVERKARNLAETPASQLTAAPISRTRPRPGSDRRSRWDRERGLVRRRQSHL